MHQIVKNSKEEEYCRTSCGFKTALLLGPLENVFRHTAGTALAVLEAISDLINSPSFLIE